MFNKHVFKKYLLKKYIQELRDISKCREYFNSVKIVTKHLNAAHKSP